MRACYRQANAAQTQQSSPIKNGRSPAFSAGDKSRWRDINGGRKRRSGRSCHALAPRGLQGQLPAIFAGGAGRFLGSNRQHGCAGLRPVGAKLSCQADPHIHSIRSRGRRRPDCEAARAEADRENKAAGRDRKSSRSRWPAFGKGGARCAARRLHARADRKRAVDLDVPVQDPTLQCADRLHLRVDFGSLRDAPCGQGGFAAQDPAGRGRRCAQESGKAQFRRHQSGKHAKSIRAPVEAGERARCLHHPLQDHPGPHNRDLA
jgi:hypothetical protein